MMKLRKPTATICCFLFLIFLTPNVNSNTKADQADDIALYLAPIWYIVPGKELIKQKWGYIDNKGNWVIQPQYEKVAHESYQIEEGYLTDNGRLYFVQSNGKQGYIWENGSWAIEPNFERIYGFSESRAYAEKGGERFVMDAFGNKVFSLLNGQKIGAYSEGLAPLLEEGGDTFYVDRQGKIVFGPLELDSTYPFSEGLAAVQSKNNGKWGYIGKNGKWIAEPQFDSVDSFKGGTAAVQKNGKWGYISKNGKWIAEPQFDSADSFKGGTAAVQKNGKWGYISKNGEWIAEPRFDSVEPFSEDLAAAQINEKWGYIDEKGNWIIHPQYDKAKNFSNGVAAVGINDMMRFINKSGAPAFSDEFPDAIVSIAAIPGYEFSEGLAAACGPSALASGDILWGFIDLKGQWKIEPQFIRFNLFENGLAFTFSGVEDQMGYINMKGEWVYSWEKYPYTLSQEILSKHVQ